MYTILGKKKINNTTFFLNNTITPLLLWVSSWDTFNCFFYDHFITTPTHTVDLQLLFRKLNSGPSGPFCCLLIFLIGNFFLLIKVPFARSREENYIMKVRLIVEWWCKLREKLLCCRFCEKRFTDPDRARLKWIGRFRF